ncbi:MAG: restriction endonuclease subunit S, partial [Waterburya sp.]
SGLDLIALYGEEGLCSEAHNAFRFKRIWVSSDRGIPFFKSTEITALYPQIAGFLSRKLTPRLNELFIKKWDVLISCSGTIGNVGLATETLTGKALTQDVIRLRSEDSDAAGYITAFLRSRYGRLQLTQATYGSVVVHIEPEHLERVLIPDLPPIRKIAIGRLMCEAGEHRDEANQLLDEADKLLHERLNLPYLNTLQSDIQGHTHTIIKASQLAGRLEASYHNPLALQAEQQLQQLPIEITTVGDERITKEVRAITKFRKRVYVEHGGIPMLSSKQLFQIAPIGIKRLAKGAHTKDLPEIQLETNMVCVTCSGTIGRVQIIPAYMSQWTANQHATRFIAASDMNPGYVYAWLASDYGNLLITRCSYGSVILEVDLGMFSSVLIPLPNLTIINEIGNLVLQANQLRDEAWRKEQEAISQLENLIKKGITSQDKIEINRDKPMDNNFKFDPQARPIWEIAAEISAQIPNSEWAKVPTDLAKNFDKYQTKTANEDGE